MPVKKQRKYNLARWAVTGRDNTAINAACQRIYQGMLADPIKLVGEYEIPVKLHREVIVNVKLAVKKEE